MLQEEGHMLNRSTQDNYQVCAVVVTYNRKKLLGECLDSLIKQTRPLDLITIVDNASNDGTDEFISHYSGRIPNMQYIRLPTNCGGAGGFYEGIKSAHTKGFDWLWLMDDDGRPDHNCLAQLLKYIDRYDVLGPLICCGNRSHSVNRCGNIITDDLNILRNTEIFFPVHPFNGTLISRRVVEKIGYPEKRLFIWGDEQDYRLRWLEAGFREASLGSALYFHPFNRLKLKSCAFWLKVPDIAPERKYLFYRNQAWLDLRHRSFLLSAFSIIRWFLSIVLFEKNKWFSLMGLLHGLRGDLSNPRV